MAARLADYIGGYSLQAAPRTDAYTPPTGKASCLNPSFDWRKDGKKCELWCKGVVRNAALLPIIDELWETASLPSAYT